LLLIALVGVALLLRLPKLASRDLWADELIQYLISSAPSNDEVFNRLVHCDRNPPGFALLVHAALGPRSTELLMRLPSLIGGIGAVVVAWYLGRRWFGTRGGAILALLCAVCPSYIFFSREARPYSVGLFAIYGFLLSLSAFRRRSDTCRAVLLGFTCLAAIALQYANAVVVGVGLGVLAWDLRRDGPGKWSSLARCGCVAGAAGATAAVTILALMRHQVEIQGTGSTDFLKDYFYHFDSLSSIVSFLPHSTAGFLKFTTFAEFMASSWGTVCLLGWLPLLPATVGVIWRPGPQRLLGTVSLGTFAAFVFLAGVGAHPFGAIRHTLPLTPGIFLLFTYGVVTLLERGGAWAPLGWACPSLLIIQMLAADYAVVPDYMTYQMRDMLAGIESKSTSEDCVVAVGPWTCASLSHYVGSSRRFANIAYVQFPWAPQLADSSDFRHAVETSFERSSNLWVLGVGPPRKIDLSEMGAVCIEERVTMGVHGFRWTLPGRGASPRPDFPSP